MSLDLILFAANTGFQYYQNHKANKLSNFGTQMEVNQLDQRFRQEEIASLQQSRDSSKQLRGALASNAAFSGMRGQMQGVGSALAVQNYNLNNYFTDESMRKMNLDFKKNDAKLQGDVFKLNNVATKSARNTNTFNNLLNTVSLNSFRSQSGPKTLAPVETGKASWVRK